MSTVDPKSIEEILALEPLVMIEWMRARYVRKLPSPTSLVEFKQHSHYLGDLANSYAFLSAVHATAAAYLRDAKRRKLDAEVIDSYTAKRDAVDDVLKGIKLQYEAFSRMITVHQQANEELRMLREV